MNPTYSLLFIQLLEFFRVKDIPTGPASCEQAAIVPVCPSVSTIALSPSQLVIVFVFRQSGSEGWKAGVCAEHGFTTNHGTSKEQGVEVDINY